MKLRKWQTLFSLFLFAGVAISGTGFMANAEEPWRVLLYQQLLAEEKCDVTLLSDLSVKQEDRGVSVIARTHCLDARRFDVLLKPGDSKYEISACAPTYC